jgi:DNA-directed RNA polymerase specialized sigma24 family protein
VDVRGAAVTEEAFAALVDRWYGSTVRLARLLARDEETARRAARGAWLAAIRDNGELTHLAVLRAAVESTAAQIAARAAEPVVDPARFELKGHRWAGWWTDEGTPQKREGTAADDEVTRALAGLDPVSAAIVALRDVERLNPQEVERVLDVTPADQRGFLARGRALVWEALG